MAGEPGYIKGLKAEMQAVTQSMGGTEKAIVRIDTTLAENLPEMKKQLSQLNGTVRQHDKDIALQRQAHEECPARAAHAKEDPDEETAFTLAKWGLKEFGVFGFEGAVIIGLIVLLMRASGLL